MPASDHPLDPSASERASVAAAAAAGVIADQAAAAAGIAVREVAGLPDLVMVRRLFDTLWSAAPTNPSVTAELLRAYAHTGQYVVVADDLTQPGHPAVAASVGFLAAPPGVALHSHVTGVLPGGRGRSLGFALKAHQRAWALASGLSEITWTFDPLIRRNAWFNLAKLGARARSYLTDFYGSMTDGVNAGDASDRLYLAWPLQDARVATALGGCPLAVDIAVERAAGAVVVLAVQDSRDKGLPRSGTEPADAPRLAWPPPPEAQTLLAQVPRDHERLRHSDPALGRAWREALRTVLAGALADGWSLRGIGREGWYVLDRGGEPADQEAR
jgi:predicted GNAT superfamily acetyltransferase